MVKISEIELPIVLKNKVLFKSGSWNGWDIRSDEVDKSVSNTKWNKKSQSLIYSHKDKEAEAWVGKVKNVYSKNGIAYGDVELWDADTALKVVYGESPMAISAGIAWPDNYEQPTNFFYRNFSLVSDPGVRDKDIFLNFSTNESKDGFKTAAFMSEIGSQITETKAEEVKVAEVPVIETPKIDSQITERRSKEEDVKMEENKIVVAEKELKQETTNPLESKIEELEARLAAVEEAPKVENFEAPKEVPKEQPKVEEVKVQETRVIEAKPVISEEMTEMLANKISEKISNKPAPMTVNEFSSDIKDSEDATIDRLTASFKN
jgi:hypothetical protein